MLVGLLIVLVITYLAPWIVSSSAGLTYDAFDLAEWTSLHPHVFQGDPPLLTTLLLRIPPVCIALIAAIHAKPGSRIWWISGISVVVIVIAMAPPLEIVTDRGNSNYRQMLALTMFTLLAGGVGMSGIFYRWRWIIIVALGLIGAVASVWGLIQAFDLFAQFYLPRTVGIGGILTTLLFLSVFVVGIVSYWRKTQGSATTTL